MDESRATSNEREDPVSVDAPEALENAAQLAVGDLNLLPLAGALGKEEGR